MTRQQADLNENELIELVSKKYLDLISHIDLIKGIDEISISFFWYRISKDKWNNAKSFRMRDLMSFKIN
ncbi:hypothetical protein [Aquimarina intermedia]|uniref:Uncharacterized protein n=1 Tax=Aquimarina intermedia TaxID=350814 RepID=A0A5S5C6S1_9FLAO|nr:hypothetical protein [Aquimarina intermedia]TYP73663.1 hypothetical protein BD809_105254 [Aquimarina intermedia]